LKSGTWFFVFVILDHFFHQSIHLHKWSEIPRPPLYPSSRTVQQFPAEPSIHEFVIFDGAEPEDSDSTKAPCRILLERVEEGPSNQKNQIDRLLALQF
jgi:hypothetical protein